MRGARRTVLPLLAALLLSACANNGPMDFRKVKAWERGTLAEESMRLGGDPVDAYVDEHTYFSKEASTGGSGVGAGGCGCN
ncbi:DUF4266 domain-containing protein [Thiohalorhabdus methylotrophus]|uniref:DUF4266 domain-containing protein n=1 Tax=Thiohalorhabdus methylotrophus TaxID=3242694 RepID=A0ABV4TY05_9GAMM